MSKKKPARNLRVVRVSRDEAARIDWLETFLLVTRARRVLAGETPPVFTAAEIRDELL